MKISALRLYQNNDFGVKNNSHPLQSGKSRNVVSSFPFYPLPEKQSLHPLNKEFYVANSNISFNGYNCPPGDFKIKTAYGINCPCCGLTMLTNKQSSAFVSRISNQTGMGIERELEKEYKYFRQNEREIADMLIESSRENPDADLNKLVELRSEESICKLEDDQKQIIGEIKQIIPELSEKKQEEILEILNKEESIIDNSNDFIYFKRKNFVYKIENFKNGCKGKDVKPSSEILKKAQTMPSSATSKDAFFVKYRRRTNEDIARRLILPAMTTTEHIKPQSRNGRNNTDNYIPLCGDCNSKRGNMPYSEWFILHPEMPNNLQRYIYQVSKLIDNGEFKDWEFYDTYVEDVIEAIKEETGGSLILSMPDNKTKIQETADSEITANNPEESVIKEKTIDELREIWMAEYKEKIQKILSLTDLKNKLYADNEFLDILEYTQNNKKLSLIKSQRRNLHEEFMRAKTRVHKAERAYKNAVEITDNQTLADALRIEAENSRRQLKETRIAYDAKTKEYGELKKNNAELKEKITTPDDIADEIHDIEMQIRRIKMSDTVPIDETMQPQIRKKILMYQSLIDELERLNKTCENNYDLSSVSAKKTAERYFILKSKLEMIQGTDLETFRNLYADSPDNINPDFILQESEKVVEDELNAVLKDPVAQYYNRKEIIKETESQKKVLEIRLDKINNLTKLQNRLEVLKQRKKEILEKFNNVNINETILKLQAEADDIIQKYVESFEYVDYQHSKPNAENDSSSS